MLFRIGFNGAKPVREICVRYNKRRANIAIKPENNVVVVPWQAITLGQYVKIRVNHQINYWIQKARATFFHSNDHKHPHIWYIRRQSLLQWKTAWIGSSWFFKRTIFWISIGPIPAFWILTLASASVMFLWMLQNSLTLLRLWLRSNAILSAAKAIASKAIIAVVINNSVAVSKVQTFISIYDYGTKYSIRNSIERLIYWDSQKKRALFNSRSKN